MIMKEKYAIDAKWQSRPWRNERREVETDKDGNPRMKRYKEGQAILNDIVFSFSVYETRTLGYLLRGHMSMRSPRDHKAICIDRQALYQELIQEEP